MSEHEQDREAVGPRLDRGVGRLAQMRAWRIYVPAWGAEPQAVSIATSRGKAHARSHATANDVGYKLKWGDFRVVRAPEFDSWIEKHGTFSWAWEHVQKMAERPNAELSGPRPLAAEGSRSNDVLCLDGKGETR